MVSERNLPIVSLGFENLRQKSQVINQNQNTDNSSRSHGRDSRGVVLNQAEIPLKKKIILFLFCFPLTTVF